jgi:hypothetical protein
MGGSVPFADQPRARSRFGECGGPWVAIRRVVGEFAEAARGGGLETAVSPCLHLIGDGEDEEAPADALGWLGAVEGLPTLHQRRTRHVV